MLAIPILHITFISHHAEEGAQKGHYGRHLNERWFIVSEKAFVLRVVSDESAKLIFFISIERELLLGHEFKQGFTVPGQSERAIEVELFDLSVG